MSRRRWGAASGGKRVLAGVRGLPALARRKVSVKPLLPREVDDMLVPPAWRKAVYANPDLPQGAVDRDAYVVCVLEQLHRALTRRDVFASPSHRWSGPRAHLLDGAEWEAVREDVLAGLCLDLPVEEHLAELVRGLDAGWKQLADRLAEAGPAAKVSIEVQDDGRVKLNVDKLGALGEPKSLAWLRKRVEKMLPKIDLPDLLFEVHAWTGFLDAFVHLGDGTTRMKDLTTSVVALLVSEACNIGLTPVVNPGYEALTRARLVHVDQYYLRADTITAANAKLIEAQAAVPIVRFWGDGLLASVDGLRFVVPVRTISSAPSPKYFGKRGITWLNAVNDQVAGIGQMVVPGTPRDSLHILDALLNLDGGVKPEMVATDNASYSDMVFGLFKILGYNFSPRFRDLDDQRFWRATMPGAETGTYGAVEDLAQPREPEQGDHALAGHAEGRGLPGHQPGPGLRPAADARTGEPARPAGAGIRRVRADRQDRAPAARGRPGRRHLPAADEPAAHRAGVPPQVREGRVPWQARHHPPGVPPSGRARDADHRSARSPPRGPPPAPGCGR